MTFSFTVRATANVPKIINKLMHNPQGRTWVGIALDVRLRVMSHVTSANNAVRAKVIIATRMNLDGSFW